MKVPFKSKIVDFLYTNIGRGHPFYLDGIIENLRRLGSAELAWRSSDVFEQSSFFPGLIWRGARRLYRIGSSESWIGRQYSRFRQGSDYNQPSLILRLAGMTLRLKYYSKGERLLVAHPLLVGILQGRPQLIYQHGETVVPGEALVRGAATVLVPTEAVAEIFCTGGYEREQLVVTGLCIEEALVAQAEAAFLARLQRLKSDERITVGVFSSGAEPSAHLKRLIVSARSLINEGGRAILFVKKSGRFDQATQVLLKEFSDQAGEISSPDERLDDKLSLVVVQYSDRTEEDRLTARFFPHFDLFVGPAHERSNWALGLGLPQAILSPSFGSYAPLNRDNLLQHGVGFELGTVGQSGQLAARLSFLRQNGELERMTRAGWGRYAIDGFATIGLWLVNQSERDEK